MNIYAELNTKPTRKDLVEFGLIFAAGLGLFGLYTMFRAHRPDTAVILWIVGGAVLVLSQVPVVGRLLYILWMGFGLTLGFLTAPVIMLVVYTLVIVPVGFWFKVTRRDTMRRQLDPAATSYWEDYPKSDDPGSYVRQF